MLIQAGKEPQRLREGHSENKENTAVFQPGEAQTPILFSEK